MSGGDEDDPAPLSELAEEIRSESEERDADGDDGGREYSPFERPDTDADPGDEGGADTGESDERAPLSEIAERIERQRTERREPDDDEAEMFEEVEVGDVDREQVWETLLSGSETEDVSTGSNAVGAGAQAERVGTPEDAPEFVVPKETFCERCPYLSDPPELACEHEGTSIVAVVDSENFRVRDCPFAGEERPEFSGQFDGM